MMILGLTGAIGCGKSTVIGDFCRFGWRVFDADGACHRLYEQEESGIPERIRSRWGGDLYDSAGKPDRARLARLVFSVPEALKELTDMVYPQLDREMERHIAAVRAAGENAVYEIPLLFEHGYEKRFDAVMAIWSRREIRFRRLREQRGFDDAEILRRENRQLPADEKLERADYAVINNGSRDELSAQIEQFLTMRNEAPEQK